jgi:hypothetical protein
LPGLFRVVGGYNATFYVRRKSLSQYHYNHLVNLSPQELFFWVVVDETLEQLGVQDLAAAFAVVAGQPIISTRAKFKGATKGTSVASIVCRRLLNYDMKHRLPIITGSSLVSLKISLTKNLGAFVGRSVPIVGWVILAYDLIRIFQKAIFKYNSLVNAEDRLSI